MTRRKFGEIDQPAGAPRQLDMLEPELFDGPTMACPICRGVVRLNSSGVGRCCVELHANGIGARSKPQAELFDDSVTAADVAEVRELADDEELDEIEYNETGAELWPDGTIRGPACGHTECRTEWRERGPEAGHCIRPDVDAPATISVEFTPAELRSLAKWLEWFDSTVEIEGGEVEPMELHARFRGALADHLAELAEEME